MFLDLMDDEFMKISYSAAGILCQIVSEGPDFWHKYLPIDCKRETILNKLELNIKKWNINSNELKYNSFDAIFQLLCQNECIESKYYAVWTLTNMTRVNPSKHCPLLANDNCIEILSKLSMNSVIPSHIRHLSSLTLFQYYLYLKDGNLTKLEESDGIEVPKEFLSDILQKKTSIDK